MGLDEVRACRACVPGGHAALGALLLPHLRPPPSGSLPAPALSTGLQKALQAPGLLGVPWALTCRTPGLWQRPVPAGLPTAPTRGPALAQAACGLLQHAVRPRLRGAGGLLSLFLPWLLSLSHSLPFRFVHVVTVLSQFCNSSC